MQRVVVTGIGVISRAGSGVEEFWQHLISGDDSVAPVEMPLTIPQVLAANVARRMDRFSNLTVTASSLALRESGITAENANFERVGTVFSTYFGPLVSNVKFSSKLLTSGPSMASPTVFAGTVPNAGVGHLCMQMGLKGVSTTLMGSSSVGYAYDLLRRGNAYAIVTGGIEEYQPMIVDTYRRMQLTDPNADAEGTGIARPLDKRRQGIAITEGAAVLVLENAQHALDRNAAILAEVVGYGNALSDVSPERANEPMSGRAFLDAMMMALEDAGLTPDDIDAIHMAACGSKYGDLAEAEAIRAVFGNERTAVLPVTTCKGATGETFGASASINLAAAVLSMANQTVPPMKYYQEPDEAIGLHVVAGAAERGNYRYMLANGFDVGGNVATLILKQVSDLGELK